MLKTRCFYEYDPTSSEPFNPTDPNQQEIPYNLEVLCRHLGQLALARRVPPDDVATRQKLLEDSVYEEATERLKHGKIHTHLGPFVSLVSPDKLPLITILELMRLQGSGGISEGVKTARALLTIGKAKAEMCRRNNVCHSWQREVL